MKIRKEEEKGYEKDIVNKCKEEPKLFYKFINGKIKTELPGGNGVTFDWTLLKGLSERTDYMLSGGLTKDNVADAIRIARPTGIDLSSGVESSPGVKSLPMMDEFFEAVRAARAMA